MKQNYFITEDEFKDIEELSSLAFTEEQIILLREPTPESEIEIKKDDNGFTYKTVKGSYMKKRMNLIFGWNWDFQILGREAFFTSGEVLVHGKLTIRSKVQIIKEQFGKHNLDFKKASKGNRSAPSNIGNSFKSAATDSFKKCASEIGLCWDIYSQDIPEPENKKEDEESYEEKKITERLIHFLKISKTADEIESTVERFKEGNEINEIRQNIINQYKSNYTKDE